MPDFLPDELVDLRDRLDRLAVDTLVPLRGAGAGAAEVRAASKAAGLYPMTQPGAGACQLALVVARDTLGRHDVGHLDGLFGPGPGVLAEVGEPLRSSHLLPVLAGDRRGGFAFTEPADVARRTWARVEGDHLIVNGQKSYVTGGADADFLTATVEIEGEGPAMVIVDTGSAGVTLTKRFGTLDGSHHAAFTFVDVPVPRHNVVGNAGEGMGRALGQISDVRLAIAANCVGLCSWLIDFVSRPELGERARLRYGDMRVKAYAARSTLYRTARLADRGDNVVNEAIAAKVFATETAGDLVDTVIQLVGGEALVEGHPLEGIYRRLRVLRLAEGETDTLCINLARGRLDLGLGRV